MPVSPVCAVHCSTPLRKKLRVPELSLTFSLCPTWFQGCPQASMELLLTYLLPVWEM